MKLDRSREKIFVALVAVFGFMLLARFARLGTSPHQPSLVPVPAPGSLGSANGAMAATEEPPRRHLVCGGESLGEHERCLSDLLALPAPQYVYYTASPDPATGQPWCPDCRRSLPAARELVAASGGSLAEVNVGPRRAWREPDHPLRTLPWLRLSGVPTFVRWGRDAAGGGAILARVDRTLERAGTEAEARQVLGSFLAETAGLGR